MDPSKQGKGSDPSSKPPVIHPQMHGQNTSVTVKSATAVPPKPQAPNLAARPPDANQMQKPQQNILPTVPTFATQNASVNLTTQQQKAVRSSMSQPSKFEFPGCYPNIFSHFGGLNYERYMELKHKVDDAIKANKIFVMPTSYPAVRRALKERGWIEKLNNQQPNTNGQDGVHDCSRALCCVRDIFYSQAQNKDQLENLVMSHLAYHVYPDLIWTMKDPRQWISSDKFQLISRYPSSCFATKSGLNRVLQRAHWFHDSGNVDTFFPRCFNLNTQDNEVNAFIHNYRLTACFSLLKWLFEQEDSKFTPTGTVPWETIEFAFKQAHKFLRSARNEDLDGSSVQEVPEEQWSTFLMNYNLAVHEGVEVCAVEKPEEHIQAIQVILDKSKPFWTQWNIDGVLSIWIVKPHASTQGRGIHLYSKLEDILINCSQLPKQGFVVQKYIERPLLVYNTKFDVRQWFLLTDTHPLTIWTYKECYLRFCSQQFSLKDFHESVHLCNNSVQHKYRNGERDPALPTQNMWDISTFQEYLEKIGKPEIWKFRVYPKIKRSLIAVLLASQEHLDRRHNFFELYGADFMLSEDFNPWLLEINHYPSMIHSTKVTAKMCPQCLEDIVKVVVDRRKDPNASTGNFELAYKQPQTSIYTGGNIIVEGKITQNSQVDTTKPSPAHANIQQGPPLATNKHQQNIDLVVVDRRNDPNASTGNFELAYKQPQTSIYTGGNIIVEGKITQNSQPVHQVDTTKPSPAHANIQQGPPPATNKQQQNIDLDSKRHLTCPIHTSRFVDPKTYFSRVVPGSIWTNPPAMNRIFAEKNNSPNKDPKFLQQAQASIEPKATIGEKSGKDSPPTTERMRKISSNKSVKCKRSEPIVRKSSIGASTSGVGSKERKPSVQGKASKEKNNSFIAKKSSKDRESSRRSRSKSKKASSKTRKKNEQQHVSRSKTVKRTKESKSSLAAHSKRHASKKRESHTSLKVSNRESVEKHKKRGSKSKER